MSNNLNASKVSLNGVQYHIRDSQQGQETVLLLHGWPDDGTIWQKQIPTLIEAGYRVICPDLPGYGLSEAPLEIERYQLANLVKDLIVLIKQLNLDKIHCVAHDYGAVLGWELAAHTELLKTYTAMSVGHLKEFLNISLTNLQVQWIYFLNIQDIAPQLYRANNGYLLKEVLRSHPYRDRLVAKALRAGNLENMQRLEKANPVPEYLLAALTQKLPESSLIKIPTLGIWSKKDDFLWESQMENSGQYISAEWQYVRIEEAGHWFMVDKPDETNQLLLNWLRKHSILG